MKRRDLFLSYKKKTKAACDSGGRNLGKGLRGVLWSFGEPARVRFQIASCDVRLLHLCPCCAAFIVLFPRYVLLP